MNQLQEALVSKVNAFVADVKTLATRAAISALAGHSGDMRVLPVPKAAKASRAVVPATPAKEQTFDKRLALYVEHNPGVKMRQLIRAMGGAAAGRLVLTTMKALREKRIIVTHGKARATRYFPAYEGAAAKVE